MNLVAACAQSIRARGRFYAKRFLKMAQYRKPKAFVLILSGLQAKLPSTAREAFEFTTDGEMK